jgi:hypothetical protein
MKKNFYLRKKLLLKLLKILYHLKEFLQKVKSNIIVILTYENSMGENGKYSLVYSNNKWGILSSRGWQKIIKEFDSLSEGLKYIKKKYWYSELKPEYN